MITSLLVWPYLRWLNSFSLSKTSVKLDSALKAVMNTFLSTPFLTVLFVTYWMTYQATLCERRCADLSTPPHPPLRAARRDLVPLPDLQAAGLPDMTTYLETVKDSFGQRYMVMATYWMTIDVLNLSLVGVLLHPRCTASALQLQPRCCCPWLAALQRTWRPDGLPPA